jgi:hypothetical protein
MTRPPATQRGDCVGRGSLGTAWGGGPPAQGGVRGVPFAVDGTVACIIGSSGGSARAEISAPGSLGGSEFAHQFISSWEAHPWRHGIERSTCRECYEILRECFAARAMFSLARISLPMNGGRSLSNGSGTRADFRWRRTKAWKVARRVSCRRFDGRCRSSVQDRRRAAQGLSTDSAGTKCRGRGANCICRPARGAWIDGSTDGDRRVRARISGHA